MWRQVLARDVAYELIPFSQRRLLHAELARALEEDGRSGAVPAAILAYHWTHSCTGIEASEWRRALMVCSIAQAALLSEALLFSVHSCSLDSISYA